RFSVCGARLSMQVTHVIIATLSEKPNDYATGLGVSADRRREAGPRILYSAGGKSKPPEVLLTAVNELKRGLSAMLGRELICEPDPRLLRPELRIAFSEPDHAAAPLNDETGGDSFSIVSGAEAVSIRSGSARGLIHGSADFLERLGARFAPGST